MNQYLSTYFKFVALAGSFIVGAVAPPAAGQTPFSHTGVDGLHPGSSVLPNEQVDAASGNLTVVATDLVLPGNAGLDLRVTRVYNSAVYPDYTNGSTALEQDSWAGIGWTLHFGRVLHPDATGGGETVIEMGDGSRHAVHNGLSGGWITTDFWLYDKTTHTLKLPNGLVYQFDRAVLLNDTLGTARYVTEIRDPYNNRITFSYFDGSGPPDGVAQIHQDLGWGQVRDVTFTYDPTLKALASMSWAGRTWTYQHQAAGPAGFSHLIGVHPPVGPGWSYEYSGLIGELTRLATPSGGYLIYGYADATRRAGTLAQLSRVVTSRTTGGPEITAGTWTYSYGTGSNQDTTVVSCPCGTSRYRFNGTGVSSDFSGWLAGTLAERTIEDAGVVLERQTYAYGPSESISNDPMVGVNGVWTYGDTRKPLLAWTTVFRGSQSWTTTPLYHFGLGNYNDYGRPYQIEEVDQVNSYQNRRTVRTFQYGFTPYIVDRIASETVRVQTSYLQVEGPVESTWSYETATGFLTSQNVFGTATTFERSAQGNFAASTDARGNRTVYGFSWGVVADVQTPGTHTTILINADGTPAIASNGVDVSTFYSYDGNGRVTWVRQNGFDGVHTEYDNVSNRFVRVGGGQSQTDYALDGFGRTTGSVNRVNLKTRVTRDACGRVTFSSAPYTAGSGTRGTTWQFDVLGRVTRETDPAGGVTTLLYSGVDVTRTDAANRTTTFEYRAFSGPGSERLYSVHDATTVTTSYGYDVHGNLTNVSGPGAGVTRTWVRDPRGLVQSDTQPEAGTTSYVYDAAGNLTQTTDANNQVTTFTYDTDNRLTVRNPPGTVGDLTITYNAAGRVASLQGGSTTTTFGYDTRGHLASRTDVTSVGTFASSYNYDADDQLTSIVYPSTRTVAYEYDLERRLTTVRQNGALFAHTFTYGDAGTLASYTTGVVGLDPVWWTSFERWIRCPQWHKREAGEPAGGSRMNSSSRLSA